MKNASLILNAVLIIAVGVLYYLHFSSTAVAPEATSMSEGPLQSIVYLNADTLLENYDFFKESKAKLEEKTKQLEAEYTNRASGLQKEIADFQRNAKSLTITQGKALQKDLMTKEQNLRMYQETLTQELVQEETKINTKLFENLTEYLKEYGTKNDVSLVLKYNRGSDVLFASEGLDITDKVTKGLNAEYQQSKKDSTSTSETALPDTADVN